MTVITEKEKQLVEKLEKATSKYKLLLDEDLEEDLDDFEQLKIIQDAFNAVDNLFAAIRQRVDNDNDFSLAFYAKKQVLDFIEFVVLDEMSNENPAKNFIKLSDSVDNIAKIVSIFLQDFYTDFGKTNKNPYVFDEDEKLSGLQDFLLNKLDYEYCVKIDDFKISPSISERLCFYSPLVLDCISEDIKTSEIINNNGTYHSSEYNDVFEGVMEKSLGDNVFNGERRAGRMFYLRTKKICKNDYVEYYYYQSNKVLSLLAKSEEDELFKKIKDDTSFSTNVVNELCFGNNFKTKLENISKTKVNKLTKKFTDKRNGKGIVKNYLNNIKDDINNLFSFDSYSPLLSNFKSTNEEYRYYENAKKIEEELIDAYNLVNAIHFNNELTLEKLDINDEKLVASGLPPLLSYYFANKVDMSSNITKEILDGKVDIVNNELVVKDEFALETLKKLESAKLSFFDCSNAIDDVFADSVLLKRNNCLRLNFDNEIIAKELQKHFTNNMNQTVGVIEKFFTSLIAEDNCLIVKRNNVNKEINAKLFVKVIVPATVDYIKNNKYSYTSSVVLKNDVFKIEKMRDDALRKKIEDFLLSQLEKLEFSAHQIANVENELRKNSIPKNTLSKLPKI